MTDSHRAESTEHAPGAGVIIEGPRLMPAQSFGALMADLIRDPNIPADKLQILAQMRRENIEAESREAYQAAYVAFQREMPAVNRDGTVTLTKDGRDLGSYPFATYEQMDKILRPRLSDQGLGLQFWSSAPEKMTDVVLVHGELFGHGWQRASTYPVPPDTGPGRNALQARGSAQSYAKRYIADLLCNIVRKGKDDDARGALEALIDPTQRAELERLLKATSTNIESWLKLMGAGTDNLADIRQRDYSRLLMSLLEVQKRKGAKTREPVR